MSSKADEEENPSKKLKTESIRLSDYVQAHVLEKEEELRKRYAESKPYQHGVFENLFREDFLRQVQEEIKKESKVNFKESDLFRVYQSIDMANLSEQEHNDVFPTVLELRRVLYSDPWRSLMERMCGLEQGTLTGKVDCACNCHICGCHLLCHDDVIGTRKISYILYLTETDWDVKEGGALELYDRVLPESLGDGKKASACAVPTSVPAGTLLPIFNHMAFFTVEPGVSFHAVQEVWGDRPRLSLQGWYHAAKVPDQIELATLQQLKTCAAEEESKQYIPLEYPTTTEGNNNEWSEQDRKYLSEYIHETYLQDDALENIQKRFEEDSSVQLRNFFRREWIEKLNAARIQREEATRKSVDEPGYYEQGTSDEWKLVGPAHKQRYLEYQGTSSKDDDKSVGAILLHLKEKVLCSVPFQRFLARITSLGLPLGQRGTIRQFRKGLDYTVAHYGLLTKKSVLDLTLCFVAGEGQQVVAPEDEKEAEKILENNEQDVLWQSGDCGGFECYIAADDENEEAPDEYNQEDDTELLSVSASNNTLSLVYRDPGTMRFVKYVGSLAPSSRWDVAMEYEVEDNDEDDVSPEEEGEETKEMDEQDDENDENE